MRIWQGALAVLLLVSFLLGCVTRIERRPYYPYVAPEEESLSQELQRILGWDRKVGWRASQEPFYQRFAKRTARTAGRLFHKKAPARTTGEELRRQVEKEQAQAIRELREQSAQE